MMVDTTQNEQSQPIKCEPGGSFELNGETYPAYVVLCEQCRREALAFENGRRYEYDKVHGKGAFDVEMEKGDAYT